MPKMIVLPESPLDTKRLSNVLERADISVTVEFSTPNTFPKEAHYYVRKNDGTIVCECIIRAFRPSLEVAELGVTKQKKSSQKVNVPLEPEQKQKLCELVKKIEAKAFSEYTK